MLQWTWFGRVVHQAYESCVDFVMIEEAPGAKNQKLRVDGGRERVLGNPREGL